MNRLEILVTISVLLQLLQIWRRPVTVINTVTTKDPNRWLADVSGVIKTTPGGGTDGTQDGNGRRDH